MWLLLTIIIAIGIYGAYCQLILFEHMREGKRAGYWIGSWFIFPENLDEIGKEYRKKLIRCLVAAMVLSVIAVQIK